MECRVCGKPIAKLNNVYPEFKRVLLEDGIITADQGLGIYDIRCFKMLLREWEQRSRIEQIRRRLI